jgi:invasion protein IalB
MRRFLFPLAAALLLAVSSGQAQTPAVPADAATNLAVSEMIGDWTVRCFRIQTIAPCDILQVASQQETQRRVLLVSIAYVPSQNVYWAQVVVPLAVALSKGMTIPAGDATLNAMRFTRCERDGCYVEQQLPDAAIQALRGMESTTINIVAYGNEQAANLPLSLNGFGQAIDRLRTEARQRATNPPAQ